MKVETHPRRHDDVHVRPTKPDVYYVLNHDLLENPRGVRWEVNVTGLPQNVSIIQLRGILNRAQEEARKGEKERARLRKIVSKQMVVDDTKGEVRDEVQHIALFHGVCPRSHTYEFPLVFDDTQPARRASEAAGTYAHKSAVITCSSLETAQCVVKTVLDMRRSVGGRRGRPVEQDGQWARVKAYIDRVEERVDDDWAQESDGDECEGTGGVEVDDGKGGKVYQVQGKLGMEVRNQILGVELSECNYILCVCRSPSFPIPLTVGGILCVYVYLYVYMNVRVCKCM